MQRVDQQMLGAQAARRIGRPAHGMLMTLPVAVLLWLMIIAAAYEVSKWVTAA